MNSVLARLQLPYVAIAIVLLCLTVYAAPAVRDSFVNLDDHSLIVRNGAIQRITPFTVEHIFLTYDPELYIPLTFLSYQLNHAVAGLSPWIYHVTNLLLHIGNALLVLWLAFLLSRNRFNVAISRAQCLAYLVCSPRLLEVDCHTIEHMRLANALCRFVELAPTRG